MRDAKGFVPRYLALMKKGFDAPLAVLLKRYPDIDLRDPRRVADCIRLLENRIKLLEREYSKQAR